MKALILILVMTLSITALAGDNIPKAANDTYNDLSGPVVYARQQCFDGTYWDTLVNMCSADDTALTAGMSLTMAGFVYDDTSPNTVDEGDVGYARMNANRSIHMVIKDGAANERGANVTATNDLQTTDATILGSKADLDSGAGTDSHPVCGIGVAASGGHVGISGDANGLDVDINTQTLTAMKISDDASANTAANPIFVQTTNGTTANAKATPEYVTSTPPTFDDDDADNCQAITAASQQYTVEGDYTQVCAIGNSVYLLWGANPTATTTVTTGYSMIVAEGTCWGPVKTTGAKVAWIGAAAAGVVCFNEFAAP